jgi:hypothetical protein
MAQDEFEAESVPPGSFIPLMLHEYFQRSFSPCFEVGDSHHPNVLDVGSNGDINASDAVAMAVSKDEFEGELVPPGSFAPVLLHEYFQRRFTPQSEVADGAESADSDLLTLPNDGCDCDTDDSDAVAVAVPKDECEFELVPPCSFVPSLLREDIPLLLHLRPLRLFAADTWSFQRAGGK